MLESRSYVDSMGSNGRGETSKQSVEPQSQRPLTFRHVDTAQREIDNCRVLLLHKVVLGETLDVQDKILRQRLELMALERRAELVRLLSVEFGEDGREGDLRDNFLLVQILEQRHGREIQCEEKEG